MGNFGKIVMVLFIMVRVLIIAGLIYLAVLEIRKAKKGRAEKNEEANRNADGKDIDRTPGSRS